MSKLSVTLMITALICSVMGQMPRRSRWTTLTSGGDQPITWSYFTANNTDGTLYLNGTLAIDFGANNFSAAVPMANDEFDVRLCMSIKDPKAVNEQGVDKTGRVENLVISIPDFSSRNASTTVLKYKFYKPDNNDYPEKLCSFNIDNNKLVNATNGWGITYLYFDSTAQKLFVDLQRPLNVTDDTEKDKTHILALGEKYEVTLNWATLPWMCNQQS